jgi:hypothetical protein
MKFAILIVTYTSAAQTKRMIQQLNNGEFDFYIHLDKKIDMETHRALFDMPNVYFVDHRIDIKWAGYSTVEGILSGIRHITATGIKYDFISLISGQDYPIKSAGYISDFLRRNKGKEFIFFRDFDTEWAEAKGRIDRYHFTDMSFKGRYTVERIVNLLLPKRKFPLDIKLLGAETFWTLSQECAEYVTHFIDANPRLSRFLKFAWGSDEFIFQSIIMNSPFRDRVVNNHYRYINWPPVGARPNIFVAADFERIMAADSLFARKFDIRTDEKIFDLLDKTNGL